MIDDIPIRFHELLIGSRPGKSNRWEIAPLVIGKSAGAIGTERTRNHVSIIVVIALLGIEISPSKNSSSFTVTGDLNCGLLVRVMSIRTKI